MKTFFVLLGITAFFLPATLHSSTAVLAEPVKFPVLINGRRVGESTVQAGTKVSVLGQTDSRVRVKYGAAEPVWVERTALRDLRVTPTPTPQPAAEQEAVAADGESTAAAPDGTAESDAKDAIAPAATADPADAQPTPVSEPVQRENFEIRLEGEKVAFERYGAGEIGVVFFSNTGDMAAEIRQSLADYEKLCAGGCSLFLWRYPETGPFAKIPETMKSFVTGSGERLDFEGVASSVVKGIKKATGLEKFLLVGNSLGGGVVLWDHSKLSKDANIKFMLISPTEMFMPEIGDIGSMERTALIAHREGDDFIKDPEILSWIGKNQSPLTKGVLSTSGHIIVGDGIKHDELATAISTFLGLSSR